MVALLLLALSLYRLALSRLRPTFSVLIGPSQLLCCSCIKFEFYSALFIHFVVFIHGKYDLVSFCSHTVHLTAFQLFVKLLFHEELSYYP